MNRLTRTRTVVWGEPLDRELLARCGDPDPRDPRAQFKPHGLWYAFGHEWVEWCRSEDFHVDRLRHAYKLTLDLRRVLCLVTEEEVEAFGREYELWDPDLPESLRGRSLGIDWARVRREYGGVEIPAYHWTLRHRLLWYYGWDVASGCVWDPALILAVESAELPATTPPPDPPYPATDA